MLFDFSVYSLFHFVFHWELLVKQLSEVRIAAFITFRLVLLIIRLGCMFIIVFK